MIDVKVVCINDDVYQAMVKDISDKIMVNLKFIEPPYVDLETAEKMLGCKRTKLLELKAEGKIRVAQEGRGFQMMFETASLREYQKSITK